MITRLWRGRATPANADAYQDLLLSTIFPRIAARNISGYLGIRLDRRDDGGEVEFMTTMLFTSLDAASEFAGGDYRTSVVPPAARALLSSFDNESVHYEVITGTGALALP